MNGRTTPGERPTDERAYEADARRWLRVYPPRWRRDRQEEVLGVLLDLRPEGACGLAVRARLDLVRGSLGFRWRTRPPFVQWLLWRFGDVTPATDHRDWVLDDTGGRFAGFRAQWLGWFGLTVLVLTLVWSDFGREPQLWMLGPVVVGLGISLMPRTWWARRLRTDLTKQEQEADLARLFDRAVPWRAKPRWAWTRRVLIPAAAMCAGAVAALVVLAGRDRLARPVIVESVQGLFTGNDASIIVLAVGLGLLGFGAYVVQLLGAASLCRRRVLGRPEQPWRATPTPVPWWLVLGLSALAALVPLGVVIPLPEPVGSTVVTVSAFALVPAVTAAFVVVVAWVRAARAVRIAPGPPLALVDVLSPRGGDRVPVDAPTLLQHRWVGYPVDCPPAPDPDRPLPGHH